MKYTLLVLSIFSILIIYAAVKHPTGMVGTTKLNGDGCSCHNPENDTTVSVWIEGPDTLQTGQSAHYKIYLTGGPQIKGGYNVAAFFGTLSVVDSFSRKINVELTHAFPQAFNMHDTINWKFEYTAPNDLGVDTIYSVAMSINGDEIPSDEDRWNFGNNFSVTVVSPVKVESQPSTAAEGFELMQNYPNPFNPSTRIKYKVPAASYVLLAVYDALGSQAATLVDEEKPAGIHEVEYSAGQNSNLSSGIYYYQLKISNFIKTKKMILLR